MLKRFTTAKPVNPVALAFFEAPKALDPGLTSHSAVESRRDDES